MAHFPLFLHNFDYLPIIGQIFMNTPLCALLVSTLEWSTNFVVVQMTSHQRKSWSCHPGPTGCQKGLISKLVEKHHPAGQGSTELPNIFLQNDVAIEEFFFDKNFK